ncbi:MAG: hypothetical protein QM706_03315 [Nitrospira sp.]
MKLKNGLSLLVIVAFTLLGLASKVNKIHVGAFEYNNPNETDLEKGNYLVKNDGTKVFGDKIKWKSGLFVKDRIGIDDQQFKISEIRGYKNENTYYGRLDNEYIKRIVHGSKLNVYVVFSTGTYMTTDSRGFSRTHTYERATHYAQRGEDGEMTVFAGQHDIKKLVADCPLAVQMASLSDRKMRRAIRKDRHYLNSIFETYNNDCKPVQ